MFGAFRTYLALIVMTGHLFGPPGLGRFAVFTFYVISGYLMTTIMHETYGFTIGGRLKFTYNRILRLYPLYWVAVACSITLILIAGQDLLLSYHNSIYMPTSLGETISNITTIFISWYPNSMQPRLVPPTWALTVEITWYALICLGLSKNIRIVIAWFNLSVLYHLGTLIFGLSWQARYYPIAAASLPFSIGAIIYFWYRNDNLLTNLLRKKHNILLSLLNLNLIVTFGLGYLLNEKPVILQFGFYMNLVFVSLYIYALLVNKTGMPFVKRRLDSFLGNFSYPIYLLHWQVGIGVSCFLFEQPFYGFSIAGLAMLLVSIICVFMLSFLLIKLVDEPIAGIRAQIKRTKPI